MSNPAYPPTFPSNPTLGQVYDSGTSGVWQFTSQGWAKKVIDRSGLTPLWPGRITDKSV